MDGRSVLLGVCAIALLALALVGLRSPSRNPARLPLSLLFADLFGINFAVLAKRLFESPGWAALEVALTAAAGPLTLHVVLAALGLARRRRGLLVALYAAFALLALPGPASVASREAATWVETRWPLFFLALWLPTLGYGVVLLVARLRRPASADDAMRARLLLGGLALGGTLAMMDLWRDVGVPVPYLSPVGMVAGAAVGAYALLRGPRGERGVAAASVVYAVAGAVAALAAYLGVFVLLRGSFALLAFGALFVTLVVALATRELSVAVTERRERLERLAVLGRFSAQMAHDLKNPLAALAGAVQVLEGMELGEAAEFVTLAREQAERVRVIVERYDRIGRVEPVKMPVRINEIAQSVARAQALARPAGVEIALDLDPNAGLVDADRDLVASALENLVKNAFDAMTSGGTVTLRTDREGGHLVVTVADTGPGMDDATAGQVFEDFFTTKKTGGGFGLAFVRRVAMAHGGEATVETQVGEGARFSLRLPA